MLVGEGKDEEVADIGTQVACVDVVCEVMQDLWVDVKLYVHSLSNK